VAEQLTDAQMDAVVAQNEQVLDFLVDSYRQFDERDRRDGATDEYGALGGVSGLAERAVELVAATPSTLLALAVRRLAKEARDA
jgi:hypothetical protein